MQEPLKPPFALISVGFLFDLKALYQKLLRTGVAVQRMHSDMIYSKDSIGFCMSILVQARLRYAGSFLSKLVMLASSAIPYPANPPQLPKNFRIVRQYA